MRLALAALALGSTVALIRSCGSAKAPEVPVAPVAPAVTPVAAVSALDDVSPVPRDVTASPAVEPLFTHEVRPVLEKRCSPCHFPGGKMYARLPFDDPATVRKLGERLFTRIDDPTEVETLRRFFAATPPTKSKDLG